MKDGQLFRVKVINSEKDLPKEKRKNYFFHDRNSKADFLRHISYCPVEELKPINYLNSYDWYLIPEPEITDEDIYAWAEKEFGESMIIPEAATFRGGKAVHDGEIKHIVPDEFDPEQIL